MWCLGGFRLVFEKLAFCLLESIVANVSELPKALPEREKHYDVVLLWGCSTSHLDPWNMAKAYASICYVLKDDGVLAFDEVDRIFNIF